jgi:hypothetical protein
MSQALLTKFYEFIDENYEEHLNNINQVVLDCASEYLHQDDSAEINSKLDFLAQLAQQIPESSVYQTFKANIYDYYASLYFGDNEDWNIIDLFIKEKQTQFNQSEIAFLENYRDSFISLYKVTEIDNNRPKQVKDLLEMNATAYEVQESNNLPPANEQDLFAVRALKNADNQLLILNQAIEYNEILLSEAFDDLKDLNEGHFNNLEHLGVDYDEEVESLHLKKARASSILAVWLEDYLIANISEEDIAEMFDDMELFYGTLKLNDKMSHFKIRKKLNKLSYLKQQDDNWIIDADTEDMGLLYLDEDILLLKMTSKATAKKHLESLHSELKELTHSPLIEKVDIEDDLNGTKTVIDEHSSTKISPELKLQLIKDIDKN